MEKIINQIKDSIAVKEKVLRDLVGLINQAAQVCIASLKNGGKILICGNGGSAADAQHISGELVGRFKKERKGFPAIALTTDTSIITAWANDYDFATIFSRQVEAQGKKGDVLLGLSTSGNSENVIKAVEQGKKQGLKTIGLLGKGGGKLKDLCDLSMVVPSKDTPRIQEAHMLVYHILCDLIEEALSSEAAVKFPVNLEEKRKYK